MKKLREIPHRNQDLASFFESQAPDLQLHDGSRVGVIGGGPAGAFFAFFLRKFAETLGLDLVVDIYEPRSFERVGPAGCNHCGGIVSESLIQLLATEGINLPPAIVQRGIDSYMLHMDVGDVRIATPREEKRIAGVYRGNGPRDSVRVEVASFDRFLLDLAISSGAKLHRKLVSRVAIDFERPKLITADGLIADYDLLAIATGINSQAAQLFGETAPEYRHPETLRTFICEFPLGRETVERHLGTSMHVYLLDVPRLEFAAIIPKDDFATLCLLGDDVDTDLVDAFFGAREVQASFPGAVVPRPACHCFPRVNTKSAVRPYDDRLVWLGDCGTARLYKDGIGSAYRTAKAAAKTAIFHGLSAADFEKHYWPACASLNFDNSIAKLIFGVTSMIQKSRLLRRGVLRMTAMEQEHMARPKHMSSVLWDVFTGSAPYKEVLLRTLHPGFVVSLMWNLVLGNLPFARMRRLSGEVYEP